MQLLPPFRSIEVAWEVLGPLFSLLIISMAYTKRNKENKKENIPEAQTTVYTAVRARAKSKICTPY
jgi:hypothetical protein